MTRTLLYKELRALLPIACLIMAMMALGVGSVFAFEFPDTNTLRPAKWLDEDRTGVLIFFVLFSLILGAGLLVNESDQGTLAFLDGLPISRTRIFLAKITAGFLVLSIIPVLGFSVDLGLDAISRDSMDGLFPWKFLLTEFVLELVVAIYLLSIATAFSFLRKWFALVVGIVFWGYLWFRESGPGWIALFDPYEALGPGLAGGGVQVPWRHVGVQLSATACLLLIAWLAFHSMGDRIQYAVDRFHRHRFLRGVGTAVRFFAPVIWIAAIVRLSSKTEPDNPVSTSVTAGEAAFGSRRTEHYEFLYRESQKKAATPMMDGADEVHEIVAGFFDAPSTTARIVVDLASPVAPHAAGQTNWTKIRLPLDDSADPHRFRQILGHETTHVYIEQLSDSRMSKIFRYVRFFHEGLATYVEQEHFATEEQQGSNRRAVAAAWSRGKIPFETLCDDSALGATRDQYLIYPVGEVFIRALVETHGKESVARLIRALGRPGAPVGMKGLALWRDTMQAADISLDKVEAAYDVACSELLEKEAEYVARLPRIAADVAREGDEIVIKPRFEGTAPGKLICARFVDDFLGIDSVYLHPREDGTVRFSRLDHPSEKLRYMLGWIVETEEHPVFEPWVEVSMP